MLTTQNRKVCPLFRLRFGIFGEQLHSRVLEHAWALPSILPPSFPDSNCLEHWNVNDTKMNTMRTSICVNPISGTVFEADVRPRQLCLSNGCSAYGLGACLCRWMARIGLNLLHLAIP